MKKCVVFFTLLIIALIIAAVAEQKQQVIKTDKVAMGDQAPPLNPIDDPLK